MSTDANNHDLQNVECHTLLPSCKISSRSPRFAKRAVTNLSDVLRRRLCLQQPAPRVVWLTVASQCFQIARVANFPTSFSFDSCVTLDGNPAFPVYSTAHALDQWFSNFFWSRIICVSRTVITYHLVPGKVNVPNIIRSKVWKTRIDANATWTKWLWQILMAIFRKQQGE